MSQLEANKAIVRRYFAAWDENNPDVLPEFIAPDVVDHMAYDGQGEGIAGYRTFFAHWHAAFPGFRSEIEEMVAEGDTVVARWRFHGTHLGLYHEVPASGRTVSFPVISMMRLRDGFIYDEWVIQDEYGLRRQIAG
jgi:steroid delta-isomerase-like uncharacterized protein